MTKSIDTSTISAAQTIAYLQNAVAPRPIALVSTVDKKGNINLSPFSFYNVVSSNPPIVVFSPARRVRDNTIKHTLENVMEVKECVIHAVSYDMVQQTSLSSTEYAKGINEFTKVGFTPIASTKIKPPRVKESTFAIECKVNDIIHFGKDGGAGNLVVCEVLMIHVAEEILNENGLIDTQKIDLVGRMGESWYVHANNDALFTIPKPLATKGIGFDQLPKEVSNSTVFTGNELAMLANVENLIAANYSSDVEIHKRAKQLLKENKVAEAWKILQQ